MKYVLVRHANQFSKKNYTFAISDELAEHAVPGAKVTMVTCRGVTDGILLTGAIEASEDDIRFLNPSATFPLREIQSVEVAIPWESVKIPPMFKRTTPKPETIYKRLKELKELGSFDTKIKVSKNFKLIDGV